MLFIGESLNATRKAVKRAIIERDESFIKQLAAVQVKSGANMLDANAGIAGRNEAEDLVWLVTQIQSEVNVPLALDSSDPDALLAAMDVHEGRPLINSLSAEPDKLEKMLPVIAKSECDIIVLCMDETGIPTDIDGRLKAAEKGVLPLLKAGKKPSEIYVDPLVMSVSVDPKAPKQVLDLFRLLSEGIGELSGVNTTGGLSNVSYGMPNRAILNRAFLTMAVLMGMNSCIVDVRDQALMSTIHAALALVDNKGFANYLKLSRKGLIVS